MKAASPAGFGGVDMGRVHAGGSDVGASRTRPGGGVFLVNAHARITCGTASPRGRHAAAGPRAGRSTIGRSSQSAPDRRIADAREILELAW
jgi:hypothetical protein